MAAEMITCEGCGYATAEAGKHCPQCGRTLRPPKTGRLRGWLQVLLGLFLVGFMGLLTYNLAPMMLTPGESVGGGGRFTGTAEQGLLILGLFGLIITFGLGSVASGLWLIATGRRSKWIIALMIGLFVLVMLAAWFTTYSLKG